MATRIVALLCYLLGLAGSAALAALVLLLGLDWLPERLPLPAPWPWLVDLSWLVVLALQHSGMARISFKQWWTRRIPPYLERSVYVAASGLVALGIGLTWQPVGGDAWWRGPKWLIAVPLLAGAFVGLVSLWFDHLGFFGLRQAWTSGQQDERDELLVVGPYRYVRHPLMAGLLVVLWVEPVMTPTLALLSGGLTVYIVLGVWLEERDLVRRFGTAYTAYRRRVPAVLPWRPPAPAARYPESDNR